MHFVLIPVFTSKSIKKEAGMGYPASFQSGGALSQIAMSIIDGQSEKTSLFREYFLRC
jgi:hypothetical protein